MTTGRLGYPGFPGTFFDGLLDHGFMEMMVGIFSIQSIRQNDTY
jgi:hypothetical protein